MPRLSHAPIYLTLPALLTWAFVGTSVEFPLDFWHHVTTGRAIWESGGILVRDSFTFTIAGEPITNQCWLAQLAMYGLMRGGGYALAQFAAAVCYSAAIGLTTVAAWRRSGNARLAAALALAALVL